MAARRVATIASRALFVASRQSAPRTSVPLLRAAVIDSPRVAVHSPRSGGHQVRWHSAESSVSKVYEFSDIKSISDAIDSDKVLIDVREPAEYEAGYIPNAINIPVASAPDALFMPADEFEDKFGFSKPTAEQELIFYCKAGVRSSAAAQLAQQIGYTKIGEYRGSWLDWQKNGGKVEKW